ISHRNVRQFRCRCVRRQGETKISSESFLLWAASPAHVLARNRQFFLWLAVPGARFGVLRRKRLLQRISRVSAGKGNRNRLNVPYLDFVGAYKELKPELDEAYFRFMSSAWYILGQEVTHFEKEFAEYCGAKCCIGVANGLEALHLILRAYEI